MSDNLTRDQVLTIRLACARHPAPAASNDPSELFTSPQSTDADTGRRTDQATGVSRFHVGTYIQNEGEQRPADPPTVEEIVAVMRKIGDRPKGDRLGALTVLLWRAGLGISEAVALQESDLDRSRGAALCVIRGPTAVGRWDASGARKHLHDAVAAAGVSRRTQPAPLRRLSKRGPRVVGPGRGAGGVCRCAR